MTYRFILVIFAIVLGNQYAFAKDPILSKYFVSKDHAQMEQIADQFEVIKKTDKGFEVLIPETRLNFFLELAPKAQLLEADIKEEFTKARRDTSHFRGYRTFNSLQDELRTLEEQYPTLVKLETYGTSQQGKPLFALKLSDNVGLDEEEPEIMLTSATHGDEIITVEVVMGFVQKWLKAYDNDSRIRELIDNHEIYFLPVINPDGYVRQIRYANGVDPNRAYPWPENPNRTPVDCVKNVMNFANKHQFKGSIDYHAYGELIMYPWAYTYNPVDSFDERTFSTLTQKMAQSNGYVSGQISDVIYIAKGSSADYYYWKNKTLALGIEVGTSKMPHSSQIEQYVNKNEEAAIRFIEYFK